MDDSFLAKVFWAEGDDDALRLRGPGAPRRSLIAYLLLGNQVVIHPAYVWQSEITNRLVLSDTQKLLGPPNVQLILGDSPNVEVYIADRIEKLKPLKKNSSSESELHQYMRHGDRLAREIDQLDGQFPDGANVYDLKWSRDEKFRSLIRRDLNNVIPLGRHLYALFHLCSGHLTAHRIAGVIPRIIAITEDKRRLVSVDSVIAALIKNGYDRGKVQPIFDRLHVLHWESHQGDGLRVPLLGRMADQNIDPDDPEVFWGVLRKLLGPDMEEKLLTRTWPETCPIVAELRGDAEWRRFVASYRQIVEAVNTEDEALREQLICDQLRVWYPRLWDEIWKVQFTKLTILSVLCTLLGLGSGMNLIACGGAFGTLVDPVGHWLKAAQQYNYGDRNALKVHIASALRGGRQRGTWM